MSEQAKVKGRCPMGCGETLFVGDGGYITCSWHACPHPDAVDLILADGETEHIAEFGPESFTLQHPLRERLDDGLFRCGLHARLAALPAAPVPPGRWRVRMVDGDLLYEPRNAPRAAETAGEQTQRTEIR